MLDIKFIRENKGKVRQAILDKGLKLNLEYLLDLDLKRRTLKQEIDELRQKKNDIANQVKNGQRSDKLIKNGKEVKKLIKQLEVRIVKVKAEYERLMGYVPQIPSSDTPIGKDEHDNKVVENVGEKPEFNFKIKDHIELGKDLDILDLERGVKVGGFRAYFLKNEGVLLHMAVLWYAMQKLLDHNFTIMIPPTLTKDSALYGTGMFPFDIDNVYKVIPAGKLKLKKEREEGTNLIGTAEVPLCSYYADEVLNEEDLPIKLCGFSQCYRSEIGSYGRDTRGIYRIHEFAKVEQVILCKNDNTVSNEWFEKLRDISQEILNELKLPHRVIQMCTGDMGAGKYKMYDIETWMPAREKYGETHSCSNMGDWQARRLNIRYKTKDGKVKFVHTLNNTAIASPRILIAILENFQEKDGSVKVPKVLEKWVGCKEITKKL